MHDINDKLTGIFILLAFINAGVWIIVARGK